MNTESYIRLAFSIVFLTSAGLQAQQINEQQKQSDDEVVHLGVFEVSSDRNDGYVPDTLVSATRFESLARDLPLTANIITQEMMEDFLITDLMDALETMVPGINADNLP